MAERYSKLFSLPENLYAQGSPVVIAAGALLKDNVTDNMLAQLKIQNISDKPIKAVKVAITPLDSVGRPLGGEIEYQYLDLSAKRDDFFGVKTPVALPDATTRSYTIRVVEVAFGDNSLWNEAGAPWETLPKQRTLVSALGDEELAEQYKEDIGNSQSDKEPTKHKDLWLCACGAINRSGEPCHKCRKSFAELTDFDIEKLKENRETWRKNGIYFEAETLMKKGAYQQAINEFARIRGWRDAHAMITACENKIKEREEKAKADALARKIKAKKVKKSIISIASAIIAFFVVCFSGYNVYFFCNSEVVSLVSSESRSNSFGSYSYKYFYDNHGNLVSEKYYYNGKLSDESTYKNRYDIYGNLVSKKYYENGKYTCEYEYEYDSIGNVIGETEPILSSSLKYEYEYEYDRYGNVVVSKKRFRNREVVSEYEYKYDNNGKVLSKKCYSDGELVSEYEYEYGNSGNILSEKYYYSEKNYHDGEFLDETSYDNNGNIVSKKYYENGKIHSEYEYINVYNEKGYLISRDIYYDGKYSCKEEYEYVAKRIWKER